MMGTTSSAVSEPSVEAVQVAVFLRQRVAAQQPASSEHSAAVSSRKRLTSGERYSGAASFVAVFPSNRSRRPGAHVAHAAVRPVQIRAAGVVHAPLTAIFRRDARSIQCRLMALGRSTCHHFVLGCCTR